MTRRARYWITYAPGLAVAMIAIAVSAALGGPVAAVLAGFVALSGFLVACGLALVVLWRYRPASVLGALALGLGLYIVALGILYVALEYFGPSQIM